VDFAALGGVVFHRTIRRFSSSYHRIGIRAEKALPVEVNNMVGIFGYPNFGFLATKSMIGVIPRSGSRAASQAS